MSSTTTKKPNHQSSSNPNSSRFSEAGFSDNGGVDEEDKMWKVYSQRMGDEKVVCPPVPVTFYRSNSGRLRIDGGLGYTPAWDTLSLAEKTELTKKTFDYLRRLYDSLRQRFNKRKKEEFMKSDKA